MPHLIEMLLVQTPILDYGPEPEPLGHEACPLGPQLEQSEYDHPLEIPFFDDPPDSLQMEIDDPPPHCCYLYLQIRQIEKSLLPEHLKYFLLVCLEVATQPCALHVLLFDCLCFLVCSLQGPLLHFGLQLGCSFSLLDFSIGLCEVCPIVECLVVARSGFPILAFKILFCTWYIADMIDTGFDRSLPELGRLLRKRAATEIELEIIEVLCVSLQHLADFGLLRSWSALDLLVCFGRILLGTESEEEGKLVRKLDP